MQHLRSTNSWHRIYGSPWPLGVAWVESECAFNFAIYSKHATQVRLQFFAEDDYEKPRHSVALHTQRHKSGPIWHIRIPAEVLHDTKYYAYRIEGPASGRGFDQHQFDAQKLLLDPYARDIFFPPKYDRTAAIQPGENLGKAPLSVLPNPMQPFDWEGDEPIHHGSELIIYEMHVKGFTHRDPSVPPERRGTFSGVIDKIPYLLDLGVTAVELMPVFQFDPQEGNYWGYMPMSFFAPHQAYACCPSPQQRHNEFREMVKQLHRAGIEVILDVVYNHTCEGDERGPTYCFKGIDASTYYVLSGDSERPFQNFSGTGNTLHTANRATRQLIVDSLRYWVKEMHVDGFRFDLASIFTRDDQGRICTSDPPIFGQIAADPDLDGVRLIAEPWDLDAYQLGSGFPGTQWMQWNSAYQRCVQSFVRGDNGKIPELMTRLHGSTDLFPDDRMHALRPFQSINYVTSHDSFTLYDLVSYNHRHNEANGHHGLDGNHDLSWNCGSEGDADLTPQILKLRQRQAKNLLTLLILSAGTPMIRMGDEFLQTQLGNNNPYNQDNEMSWLDWNRIEQFSEHHAFCKNLITFRRRHPTWARHQFWHDAIHWYGTQHAPDLSDTSQQLAFCLHGTPDDPTDYYVMMNAAGTATRFGVHEKSAGSWRVVLDTAREPSWMELEYAPVLDATSMSLEDRSVVVLQSPNGWA